MIFSIYIYGYVMYSYILKAKDNCGNDFSHVSCKRLLLVVPITRPMMVSGRVC